VDKFIIYLFGISASIIVFFVLLDLLFDWLKKNKGALRLSRKKCEHPDSCKKFIQRINDVSVLWRCRKCKKYYVTEKTISDIKKGDNDGS